MTTDLDRALIALRVSRDHGHGAVLNDADVPALLAEIDRLTRERDELSDEVELKSACINGMSQATDKLAGERDEARAERDELRRQLDEAEQDARRYRWLAGHCRSTSEHWGGRWSIIVDGPAPKAHDSEDAFDAAIDAAMRLTRPAEES